MTLLLVAGFSLAGARLLYTSQEADVKSAANQGQYEADVVAREIARSAYNAAVADVHRRGTDIDLALSEFGPSVEDCANSKPACFRRTGEMLGGTYIVEASADGGNGIDIFASGTFGYDAGSQRVSKTHTINETQTVGVLQVAKGGKLRIQFVDSNAGYCSAIFLQRTIPGRPASEQPGIEMVYSPGKNRNGSRNNGFEVALAPGTQMNFAIGVDYGTRANSYDCHKDGKGRPARFPDLQMFNAERLVKRPDPNTANPDLLYGEKLLAAEMARYTFENSDWNWVHWALDGSALRDGDPKEGPWAMVETDPNNNQRWRIAFEDINKWNLASGHADYDNPNKSLWATKRFGYDWQGTFADSKGKHDAQGNGWTDDVCTEIKLDPAKAGAYVVSSVRGVSDGFHDLRDTGDVPDFSDQVIMVEIVQPGETGSGLTHECKKPA